MKTHLEEDTRCLQAKLGENLESPWSTSLASGDNKLHMHIGKNEGPFRNTGTIARQTLFSQTSNLATIRRELKEEGRPLPSND